MKFLDVLGTAKTFLADAARDWLGIVLWLVWSSTLGYLAGTMALLGSDGHQAIAVQGFLAIVALSTVSRVRGIRAALAGRFES
jgi:hypothetical protein